VIAIAAARLGPDPELSSGNLVGKRYVDHGGADVHVTGGQGHTEVANTPLAIKEAQPPPASD
jgi:hypothetical protein